MALFSPKPERIGRPDGPPAEDRVSEERDRGLLHPELVRSATREEAAYAKEHPADLYVSASRTCEMGLLHATGRAYESFVFALEEMTRAQTSRGTSR